MPCCQGKLVRVGIVRPASYVVICRQSSAIGSQQLVGCVLVLPFPLTLPPVRKTRIQGDPTTRAENIFLHSLFTFLWVVVLWHLLRSLKPAANERQCKPPSWHQSVSTLMKPHANLAPQNYFWIIITIPFTFAYSSGVKFHEIHSRFKAWLSYNRPSNSSFPPNPCKSHSQMICWGR